MENKAQARKYYLDNLRALTILLLFPFHTFMIYNNFGENWYVYSAGMVIPTVFIRVMAVWMMPLLFAVAGMSSAYALKRRSFMEYANERVQKLLVPLIFGVILLVPVQPYIAGIFYKGSAGYFDSFIKLTDWSGYDGAFTPAHLWFIAYLFVISLVSIPLMRYCKSSEKKLAADRIPLAVLILLAIVPLLTHYILNIGGKSLGEYVTYFLFGYFFLTDEKVLEKLDRHRFLLLALMVCGLVECALNNGMFREFFAWISILAILGLGRHYLNFKNKVTDYLSKSSFGIYLFHQSWIVVIGYFTLKATDNPSLQILIILALSIILTYSTYELARRFRITRWMFGLKK